LPRKRETVNARERPVRPLQGHGAHVVATTPLIPGLAVQIPAGVILRTYDGGPLTALSLTRIPVDRPGDWCAAWAAAFPLEPALAGPVVKRTCAKGMRAPCGPSAPFTETVYAAPDDTNRNVHLEAGGLVAITSLEPSRAEPRNLLLAQKHQTGYSR
jgi:hypothetical protein